MVHVCEHTRYVDTKTIWQITFVENKQQVNLYRILVKYRSKHCIYQVLRVQWLFQIKTHSYELQMEILYHFRTISEKNY